MLASAPVLRTTAVALAFVVAPVLLTGSVARGNPAGVVPSALAPGIQETVHFEAGFAYELDSASITREHTGDPTADPLAPLPVQRALEFRGARQVLTPKLELGVYRNVWISFAAPIVVSQSRDLELGSGVDRATSTTFTDGILPAGGFDARTPDRPLAGALVFRDVSRAGVRELRGGLGFAPMNQALDDTKPTWKLGVEGQFSIGRVMRFDALDPESETGIASGVHQLRLWTSVDRRAGYFEGWFEASWQVPVYRRSSSQFRDPGFGAVNIDPGQTAGTAFGLEAYLIDDPASGNRASVELGARLAAHLEGRDYSELWQVFALAGDARRDGPLVLDGDPVAPGTQALSHPGISNIEGYLETASRVALRGRVGRHLTFSALGELVWKTDHLISFADTGIDLPTCPTGAPRCETTTNDLVNPSTPEVNPLHAREIDLVGHRYRSEDNRGIVLGAELQLQF